jgi:hypothetical protein
MPESTAKSWNPIRTLGQNCQVAYFVPLDQPFGFQAARLGGHFKLAIENHKRVNADRR